MSRDISDAAIKAFIENLNIGVDRHPELMVSKKSGRAMNDKERAEFFNSLHQHAVTQPASLNPLIQHTGNLLPSLISQPKPSNAVTEDAQRFGKWIEENFHDPMLLKDSAFAIGAISRASSQGLPISSAANSILPVIIQIAAKIIGVG